MRRVRQPDLPTGVLTFLFTDIEGSTRMLAALGDTYAAQLATHNAILRQAIEGAAGRAIATHGDAFFAVFREPLAALSAAVEAQRRLQQAPWVEDWPVRVRMGMHSGEAILGGDDYVGLAVHRAARIADAAHGGQVLLSAPTAEAVREAMTPGVTFRDLGEHWLKDLERPEPLVQLVIEGLRSDFPPLRAQERRPSNLPAELSSFVGRDAERNDVQRTLEQARLVTLVGPGGTGKTRLVLRVAADVGVRFSDGIAFVPLEDVSDAEVLPSAIADAIGLQPDPAQPVMAALIDAVRDRELLLVLDAVEQVAGASGLVGQLLGSAPRLRVLATSRLPLHLPGERLLTLAPLTLPDPTRNYGVDELARVDAVSLFVSRAQDADDRFALTDQNAPAVAAICARLDGLPLAIELAAARTRVLSPDAILARLERPLAALSSAGSPQADQQRTLRGAIAWSHDLLEPTERALFRRLAVCAGGCDLYAAEAIAGSIQDDVLDGLSALVDKSLVRRVDRAGEPRFGMLATIREFAAERLAEDAEEERETRRRHAEYWLTVANRLVPQVGRANDAALELASERENLRAALHFTLGADASATDVGTGVALASAMGPYWLMTSPTEGSEWLDRAIARSAAGERRDAALEGRMEFYRGAMLETQGRADQAEQHLEHALDRFREVGDREWQGRSLNSLGAVARAHGDRPRARRLLGESLAIATELGMEGRMATALSNLGLVDVDEGDLDSARAHFQASLEVDRRSGNQDGIASDVTNLADVALRAGDVPAAAPLIAESLPTFARLGDLLGVAGDLEHVAEVAASRNETVRAARLIGAAEALRRREGLEIASIEADRYRHLVATIRASAGELAFADAYRAGSLMGTDAAIAEALELLAPG